MVAWSCTLKQFIRNAYNFDTSGSVEIRILGAPNWADEDQFDLEAKPPESSASGHWVPAKSTAPPTPEMRLMLRALLADRFQLQVHLEAKMEPVLALVVAKGGPRLKKSDGLAPPSLVARKVGSMDRMETLLTGQNAGMGMFAAGLAQTLKRTVLDRTAPPLFKSLERQLGLKLETERAPIDVLVIDHAEKPAGN
jgi:uncharacterized protein (TIGR03435 family)